MIVTEPADTPVTIPVALTVALLTSLLLQVPPGAVSPRVVVLPAHNVDDPLMLPALGAVLTVTVCVAATVPQLPPTV